MHSREGSLDLEYIVQHQVSWEELEPSEPFKKKGVDVYSDLSYQLLMYFGWRMYYGVEGSEFNVVNGTDWIPSHVRRDFDEEKLVRLSVLVFFLISINEAVPIF